MATNTDIPQGYKATALGIIPQEWEVMPLSKAFHLQSGYAFKSELFSADQGIPIVRISNLPIDNKYVDLSDCVYYPASENIKQQFIVHKKDLLIAMSGATTGKTAIYNYSYNAFLNQRVGVFKQTSDKVCYQYLQAIVESQLFTTRLQPLLIAGAQPNISPSDIENMIFPVPPLAEQRKIAEVLGVWDEAIEKQARLIEKLTLRKRALMQRLITGKKRLHGFSGEWQKVVLSSLIEKVSNGYVYDVNSIGNVPITRIETISKGIIDYTKIGYIQYVEGLEKYKLQEGDILFSHINSIAHIGKVAIFKGDKELYHGMNLLLIRAKGTVNKNYLYYFLSSTIARRKVISLAKLAVNQASINTDELKKWTIRIPEVEEQNSIAQVLTAADREIDLAKEKLERLRRQKRGLMQQLLTGKKRVKY